MRKLLTIVLLLILAATGARAENIIGTPPSDNWNKVQSLSAGVNLTIELKHKQEIIGEFVHLDENAIVINELGRERIYPKDSVARVKLMRPGSRARNAAIVGGIFFGAGFGLGYASAANIADQNTMRSAERAQVGAAAGGLIGGIAAAIALAHHPGTQNEVIYRAR